MVSTGHRTRHSNDVIPRLRQGLPVSTSPTADAQISSSSACSGDPVITRAARKANHQVGQTDWRSDREAAALPNASSRWSKSAAGATSSAKG
jgi:hypothetical protein